MLNSKATSVVCNVSHIMQRDEQMLLSKCYSPI